MAFTVETGSIVTGANAYVTLEEFASYHTDRANTYSATDPQIQAAIIKATAYIDGKYRNRWKGARVNATQPLLWPRYGVRLEDYLNTNTLSPTYYDSEYSGFIAPTVIPQQLKDAVCEAALRAITATLAPDLERGGRVKREKVDVIETEYMDGAPASTSYQIIDQILGGLLKTGGDLVRG